MTKTASIDLAYRALLEATISDAYSGGDFIGKFPLYYLYMHSYIFW